jgi:hypothetical protein
MVPSATTTFTPRMSMDTHSGHRSLMSMAKPIAFGPVSGPLNRVFRMMNCSSEDLIGGPPVIPADHLASVQLRANSNLDAVVGVKGRNVSEILTVFVPAGSRGPS